MEYKILARRLKEIVQSLDSLSEDMVSIYTRIILVFARRNHKKLTVIT